MKKIIAAALFLLVLAVAACVFNGDGRAAGANERSPERVEKKMPDERTPVLVELFTSEGCSSCPPADRVLSRLQTEQPVETAEVIALAFHVDYWNYLGWRDGFSFPEYSRRQNEYTDALGLDSNYTPQMIVDGRNEFVGSSWNRAIEEIGRASERKKTRIEIESENDVLKIMIRDLQSPDEAYVLLAVAEDKLATDVKRGENSGRKLAHTAVVRELKTVGTVDSTDKSFTAEIAVEIKEGWKRADLRAVVFLQNKKTYEVHAVGAKVF